MNAASLAKLCRSITAVCKVLHLIFCFLLTNIHYCIALLFFYNTSPTVQRACILTGTQIPSYDHSKHMLLEWVGHDRDGLLVHFVCSMFAGLVCSTSTSPVDVVKSRMMNQSFDQYGRGLLYQSSMGRSCAVLCCAVLHCLTKECGNILIMIRMI